MALIALNRQNELGFYIPAALRNGLSREEIGEVLLQSAIYCGVPLRMERSRPSGSHGRRGGD